MIQDARRYWTERYRREGRHYVAKGGRQASYRAQVKALTPYLRAHVTGARVLDFGCGPGRFRPVLEEGGREYVGVDLIPEFSSVPPSDKLPGGFDSAAAVMVLQHITDEAEYVRWVRELYTALVPGGRLIVIDHEPRPGMAPHMAPRGVDGLTGSAPWSAVHIAGEFDGHYVAVLERGEAELPAWTPPAVQVRERAPVPVTTAASAVAHPLRALVLGGASCVWSDVRALEDMLGHPWDGLVIAANDIGCHWPGRLDHWATLHPEKFKRWAGARKDAGHPRDYTTWTAENRAGVTDRRLKNMGAGASGLLATTVALEALGCTHVVLCGVPMTRTPHFEQSKVHVLNRNWTSADSHWRAWQKPPVPAKLRDRVRSMSGRTMELLGAPTMEWLGESEATLRTKTCAVG